MCSDPTSAVEGGSAQRFAVAITCIDGRVHGPLLDWARTALGVDHLDLITEPGPDLAVCCAPSGALERIRAHLGVSFGSHAPTALVVSGHEDCAANPVSADEHRAQIARSVERAATWTDLAVSGVWIASDGTVTEIGPAPAAACSDRSGC